MSSLRQRLLDLIQHPNYQPAPPKAIARKLGLRSSDAVGFRRLVKELIAEGRLEIGKRRVLQCPRPHGAVSGVFRKLPSGAGLVRPKQGERFAGQEIFVPPHAVGDASTGDEVLVKVDRGGRRDGRGPRGEILKIVERLTQQFVGTYLERDGEGLVQPDGTALHEAIFVGDARAKGVRPNDQVVFEMIRFPGPAARGEGVITEVLGPRGQPGVDLLTVIRAYGLPDRFPPDALEEARRQAAAFSEEDLSGRADLREELCLTIDPPDAHDFDDAIGLTFDAKRNHWRLSVHIADVGHFVPPGSALDREAKVRGTSVYLPGRVLPMFPELLSNGLASLQEGRTRYVQTVRMEFAAKGEPIHAEFVRGAIRVAKRFSYGEVAELLQAAAAPPAGVEPELLALLRRMRDFALILRERRLARGALELDMPEVELEYDAEGKVVGGHRRPRDVSHTIVEEFMLAANEAVAGQLDRLGVSFLRRNHDAPDPLKLERFLHFAQSLGFQADLRKPAADRFQLQRLLAESASTPQRQAVHYALLRSLRQADYGPDDLGHYALASRHYCHFTSPIRRYPDLTVHRLLARWQKSGRAGSDEAELAALGEHCSFTERRAARAEQELVKLKLLAYLSERIGLEQEIVITGVEEFGFFGQAETLPIEGLVHVSSLMDDDYWFDEASHSLIGRRTKRRFRLGDAVRVKVARVDLAKRQLDFRLAGAPLPPHAEPPMHRHRAERPPPSKPRPKPKRQGQRKPKRKR